MVDFLYRECRSITKGPLAFIRLGTCGTPSTEIDIGTICVSESSRFCNINYAACLQGLPQSERYSLTPAVKADTELIGEVLLFWLYLKFFSSSYKRLSKRCSPL